MTFPDSIRVPIANAIDGSRYELVRASDVDRGPENLARIVGICNEPDIYDWLFRGLLEGNPYPEDKAREFLEWSGAGWAAGTHFVFVVLDGEQRVAAACDIKSSDPVAEVGYWASRGHRGVMANSVRALCALAAGAGFEGLFARTKPGNTRSQGVLLRAGFARVKDDADGYARFELQLGG